MKRRTFAVLVSASLAVLVTGALAQTPFSVESKPEPNPYAVKEEPKAQLHGELIMRSPGGSDLPITLIGSVAADPRRVIDQLVENWKKAGNKSDRDKVQQSLRVALKEEFHSRLAAHEKEIEQLEAEVQRLRHQLDLRRQKQDEIVDFRLQQVLREAQGLGWGTEPTTRTGTLLPPGLPAAGGNMTLGITSAEFDTYSGASSLPATTSGAAVIAPVPVAPIMGPTPPTTTPRAPSAGPTPPTAPAAPGIAPSAGPTPPTAPAPAVEVAPTTGPTPPATPAPAAEAAPVDNSSGTSSITPASRPR